jgi:chemotaxis protein methyltransferase CheR
MESALTMETQLLHRFTQLIALHTGLQMRAEEADKLRHTIRVRMAAQQLINPETYYQLLSIDTAASRREWEELVLPLTIGESYFFRDSGQFSLLRQKIIPELIERNLGARSLRIWSAGCSTGEEPYSLAILVNELLPSCGDWSVIILGTDVNKRAIADARRGLYRQHSLRMLDQAQRKRYFHQHRDHWELDERFRAMVSFHQVNLLNDPFPDAAVSLAEMDLILCRNVFIYFDRTAVARVLTKFTKTLKVGGYLVTGHAELHDQKSPDLTLKSFAESIIYRRHDAPRASGTRTLEGYMGGAPSMTPRSALQGSSSKPVPASQPLTSASLPAKVSRTATPRSGDKAPKAQPTSAADLYKQARGYADVGQYEAAIGACQLALNSDALAEKPYYLLAQIAEIQGNMTAAKDFLKKILYIAPASVAAHLELGALYAKEEDLPRAWNMLNLALELLKTSPPNAVVEPFADLRASQLLSEVQRRIERLGYPSDGRG